MDRANKAQYAEVSLHSFNEEDILDAVALPSVQGLPEEDCKSDSR